MEITLDLTDAQVAALLTQLQPLAPKRSKVTLTSDDYITLYWSGRSARSLAAEYGVNHNHFIRVWKRLGLDTILAPSERPKRKQRIDHSSS